jgi:hypothetical protein
MLRYMLRLRVATASDPGKTGCLPVCRSDTLHVDAAHHCGRELAASGPSSDPNSNGITEALWRPRRPSLSCKPSRPSPSRSRRRAGSTSTPAVKPRQIPHPSLCALCAPAGRDGLDRQHRRLGWKRDLSCGGPTSGADWSRTGRRLPPRMGFRSLFAPSKRPRPLGTHHHARTTDGQRGRTRST